MFDFYFTVYNKIIRDIKTPFKIEGGDRIDDTPVHKAIREALANCLVNTDFFGTRGVVIKKEPNSLTIENPGYIRVGKYQMRRGGESDPRNKTLMKMFNLINIGERAGSGVPELFSVWAQEGWEDPVIEERFGGAERTILKLSFEKKATEKSDRKKRQKKATENIAKNEMTDKQRQQLEFVYNKFESGREYRIEEIANLIGLKRTRTRELIKNLVEEGKIIEEGKTKTKRYKRR